MRYRTTSRLGRPLSVVGQGCWQLGADWGEVSEAQAAEVLKTGWDCGITFFDTADVYGDGRSEQFLRTFRESAGTLAPTSEAELFIATKASRRADPFTLESFTEENIRGWVERSRTNLGQDTLDLVQLHCPPPAVYHEHRIYELMDTLVDEGKLAAWGVSVETTQEALTALNHDSVASVQIILNPFRLKPLEEVVPKAQEIGAAIIARVPLASGLLSGRYDATTTFPENDHRTFNRFGQMFDRGETFSGVDFETGLEGVARLTEALNGEMSLPEASLRWIIDQPGVTAVIPGARSGEQVRSNARAGEAPTEAEQQIIDRFDAAVHEVYDDLFRAQIHPQW